MKKRLHKDYMYDPLLEDMCIDTYLKTAPERHEARQRYFDSLFHLPNITIRKPEYIIEDILPKGYLAILAGDPKVGKTFLTTAMALAVATGSPFAGKRTLQSSVLWLSLEESPAERSAAIGSFDELQKTYKWTDVPSSSESRDYAGKPKEIQVPLPIYTCYEKIAIDTEEGIGAIDHWVLRVRANLVVIDPLHAAHSGRSLTDGWSARRTLQLIKEFCSLRRITVLILHHLTSRGKNCRVAENAQLAATASMFMLMNPIAPPVTGNPQGESEAPKQFSLACRGRGEINRTWFLESEGSKQFRMFTPPVVPLANPKKTATDLVLDAFHSTSTPVCANDLETVHGLAASTIRNALTSLERSGAITLHHIDNKRRYFVLAESSQQNNQNPQNLQKQENQNGK